MSIRQQTQKHYDDHKIARRKAREAEAVAHRLARRERAAAGERDRRREAAREACRGRFSHDD